LSERLTSKRALMLIGASCLLRSFALMVHQVFVIVFAQAIIVTGMVMYGITFDFEVIAVRAYY
jgi:hypothetical protein